jgi:hypothetical protein
LWWIKYLGMITIVPYRAEYTEHIKSLNYEWLEKYFAVEPNDVIQLSNPQVEILDNGGKIFSALDDKAVIGTASLLKVSDEEYELAKCLWSIVLKKQKKTKCKKTNACF